MSKLDHSKLNQIDIEGMPSVLDGKSKDIPQNDTDGGDMKTVSVKEQLVRAKNRMQEHADKIAFTGVAEDLLPDLSEDPATIINRNREIAEKKEMQEHADKLAFTGDTEDLLPDLGADPAIAFKKNKMEKMASGTTKTSVYVDRMPPNATHSVETIPDIPDLHSGMIQKEGGNHKKELPPEATHSIELSDDLQEEQNAIRENEAFDAARQKEIDKKIAKAGYDKDFQEGDQIEKTPIRKGTEKFGDAMTAMFDKGQDAIFEGKTIKGTRKKDKWEKIANRIDEDDDADLIAKTAQREQKEADRLRKQIQQEGFAQVSESDKNTSLPKSAARKAVETVGSGLHSVLETSQDALYQGKTVTMPEEEPKQEKRSWFKRLFGRKNK